jgi:hypothetical protein
MSSRTLLVKLLKQYLIATGINSRADTVMLVVVWFLVPCLSHAAPKGMK